MIKKSIRKAYPILFLALTFAITGMALQLKAMYITKDLIDNALSAERSTIFFKTNAIKMLLWASFSIFFVLVGNFFESLYYRKASEYIKSFYLKKLFQKNINEFQAENTAKYYSNLTNDISKIEAKYIMYLYEILYMVFQVSLSIGVLIYVNYIILVAGIGIGVIFAILLVLFGLPMQKHQKQLSDILGKYTEYVKEILCAFQIIKVNNLQKKAESDFYQKSKKVEDKEFFVDRLMAYILLIVIAVIVFLVLGAILGGIYLVYLNFITIGTLIFAMSPMSRIITTFGSMGDLIQGISSLKKVFQSIDDNLKKSISNNETIELNSFNFSIEFKNVSFSYGENVVLKDVNLKFEKGKKYLITGHSGGGKTTVLKLLRKYFNPTQGEILVDGKALKDITTFSYFKNIANIEQQVFLFEDSLYNNITLYKSYTKKEIDEALKNAGLISFVENLKEGLNYKITDNGKNISGGEKARIAIARALITKTNIIFLDEAFASLDKMTAIHIEKTLLNLKDITVINVSHVIFDETKDAYDSLFKVKNKTIEIV